MSRSFLNDQWGHVLPAIDHTDPEQVRKYQVRAVGWGARVGYSLQEQKDALEMLGLLDYPSKPRTDR